MKSVLDHYTSINSTLGEYSIGAPASLSSELGAAIKGKRTISSITDAVDAAVAQAKIAASQRADAIRANVLVLAEFPDALHLLPDRVQLCATLPSDALRSVIKDRIDEAAMKDAARLETDRERIRLEEEAKAQAKAFDKLNSHEERLKHCDLGNVLRAAPAQTDAGIAVAGTAPNAEAGDARPQPSANNLCVAVAEYYEVSTATAWAWLVDAFSQAEKDAA